MSVETFWLPTICAFHHLGSKPERTVGFDRRLCRRE
ncbi:hypothetical protein FHW94_002824 [Novosphingobium sp. SG720]|nr:hypothetical protein [Novosphingobium sp. SG720]